MSLTPGIKQNMQMEWDNLGLEFSPCSHATKNTLEDAVL